MVEVQPEPPEGLGTGDAVDHQLRAPLKLSDGSGGAWAIDAVDDEVGLQRIVAIQPGLQQPDRSSLSPGRKTTAIASTLRRIPFSSNGIDSRPPEQSDAASRHGVSVAL